MSSMLDQEKDRQRSLQRPDKEGDGDHNLQNVNHCQQPQEQLEKDQGHFEETLTVVCKASQIQRDKSLDLLDYNNNFYHENRSSMQGGIGYFQGRDLQTPGWCQNECFFQQSDDELPLSTLEIERIMNRDAILAMPHIGEYDLFANYQNEDFIARLSSEMVDQFNSTIEMDSIEREKKEAQRAFAMKQNFGYYSPMMTPNDKLFEDDSNNLFDLDFQGTSNWIGQDDFQHQQQLLNSFVPFASPGYPTNFDSMSATPCGNPINSDTYLFIPTPMPMNDTSDNGITVLPPYDRERRESQVVEEESTKNDDEKFEELQPQQIEGKLWIDDSLTPMGPTPQGDVNQLIDNETDGDESNFQDEDISVVLKHIPEFKTSHRHRKRRGAPNKGLVSNNTVEKFKPQRQKLFRSFKTFYERRIMPGVGVAMQKRRKNKEGTISEEDQRQLSENDSFKLLGGKLLSSVPAKVSSSLIE